MYFDWMSCVNKLLRKKHYYFTTITKQVIQLILIILIGTDFDVAMVFMCGGNRSPLGKPTCLTW